MIHSLTPAEENYIKRIFALLEKDKNLDVVTTNDIANSMNYSAASATEMTKKLAEKGYLQYEPYKGSSLTKTGIEVAKTVIRKHRLWEVFLVNELHFTWDQVHPIAEQLEHIHSDELIDKLDDYLGNPKFDPHGDPIPDKYGTIARNNHILLSQLPINKVAIVVGVQIHDSQFLKYLESMELILGSEITIHKIEAFDNSLDVTINGTIHKSISKKVSQNLFVEMV